MKAIMNRLDRFCYNHPNFGIPNLMKYVALGNVIVYLLDGFTNSFASMMLMFRPDLILQGQVWRVLTFIFVPEMGGTGFLNALLFVISTYFYYQIGSLLERQWGTARFSVFYLLGVTFNVLIGFGFYSVVTMSYVNMSMFFSFATLYPDMQVLLYGIIPLRVKWLAWLNAALFGYNIFANLLAGYWAYALLPIIALLNYFLFFWGDFSSSFRRGRERVRHRTNPQTVNFKKAQKEIRENRGYLHKCSVCGITDADDRDMEFRYCSKCSGYYCYCMNHINNHTHVQ